MDLKVMILVGNGFDIGTLKHFGAQRTTAYADFFEHYLDSEPDTVNCIIRAMSEAKERGKSNWSDIEQVLGDFINNTASSKDGVVLMRNDLYVIQKRFSRYLNQLVTDDMIERVSDYCQSNLAAVNSFKNCIDGLSESQYDKIIFPSKADNHNRIDFSVINFNYTPLLDNYLCLDLIQFDPKPYLSSDNNLTLGLNPEGFKSQKRGFKDAYVRINSTVYHPHGYQDVPKSLLFGSEAKDANQFIEKGDVRKFFIKSFCARCDEKYDHLFEGVDLFVIYGCSLGNSDSWWWNRVLNRLLDARGESELVIYNYGSEDEDTIKNRFIFNSHYTDVDSHCLIINEEVQEWVKERIFVVNHGPNEKRIKFLQYET